MLFEWSKFREECVPPLLCVARCYHISSFVGASTVTTLKLGGRGPNTSLPNSRKGPMTVKKEKKTNQLLLRCRRFWQQTNLGREEKTERPRVCTNTDCTACVHRKECKQWAPKRHVLRNKRTHTQAHMCDDVKEIGMVVMQQPFHARQTRNTAFRRGPTLQVGTLDRQGLSSPASNWKESEEKIAKKATFLNIKAHL